MIDLSTEHRDAAVAGLLISVLCGAAVFWCLYRLRQDRAANYAEGRIAGILVGARIYEQAYARATSPGASGS